MTQKVEALAVVEMLYRTALEPEMWPEALEMFASAVGCIGMAMIPITPNEMTGLVVSPSMRDVETAYRRGWCEHDSRVGRIFARGLSGGVVCEPELFEDSEIARDPFRQEFCRNWGIGVFAAQLVAPWPGKVVAFSAQRGLASGHFEASEVELLRLLGQHAARALTLSTRYAAANRMIGGLMDVIERFDGAVFVMDQRAEVAAMNRCAEALLGDGLSVTRRGLYAASKDRQKALDLLIVGALDGTRTGVAQRPVALPRPSGRKPLLAQCIPLVQRNAPTGSGGMLAARGALLLVVDPESGGVVPHDSLQLLGLTAAEAKLASLIGGGMRRRDAAEALGISEWTARDCLKHIYSKLDITSQSALVRLVDRIAALSIPARQAADPASALVFQGGLR